MGRVSRHKKIKAVDPFSRTHGVVDVLGGKVYDLAPKARDIDRMPTKLRMMHRKPESKEKKLPTRMFKHLESIPGESMKTFAKRVNTELKKRIVEVKEANPVFELKGVNVARKGYLDARAEKKRRRKAGLPAEMIMPEAEEEAPPAAAAGAGVRAASSGGGGKTGAITAGAVDTSVQLAGHKRPRPRYEADDGTDERDFTCDHVAFGERAERPPTFTAQPRKSKRQRDAEALTALQKLHNKGRHGEEDDDGEDEEAGDSKPSSSGHSKSPTALKPEEKARAAALQKAQMERMRAEAMAAYATLKRKRVSEQTEYSEGRGSRR